MISNPLANLVKRSPLISIQEHMRVVLECARDVPVLIQALCDEDMDAFEASRNRISEKEEEADRIKNDLRGKLPKSLFMPIDRRDLLEVLHIQDSIADTAQDIADLLFIRKMSVPAAMQEPVLEATRCSLVVCEFSLTVIEELDELLATGFRGNGAKQVEHMVDHLNRIEDQADAAERDLSRTLMTLEPELDPVTVMMWYQLIEWIGDLADGAEKVGDRIRLFIAN